MSEWRPYVLLLCDPREKIMMRVIVGTTPVNAFSKRVRRKIWRYVLDCIKEFPDCAEGTITLDGVEHFFTYVVDGFIADVSVMPRDLAEQTLNQGGLSTYDHDIRDRS